MYKAVLPAMIVVGATSAALMPGAAHAAAGMQFASDVFVERFQPAPGGRTARILERADQLRPGDRVIFVVNWSGRKDGGFTVTNPLPRTIAFAGATDETQEVSVDGGRTWGALEALTVHDAAGRARPAHAEDVTHLRWRIPAPQALAGAGQMTWRGVVR
ncbi:hypothetical protein AQZ52_12755 [Novosphingobium fuchskuhlense]|uniref:Uncharacterized protein n=1 Tax=Novosphingobium fuchskuhlense TaxID=1117702 RepID=A0A124JTZ8_9SPHN|nr:hypothetical protein [Novosphingobium fuchskuhlense]KUR70714.1 hypothetical protein AQZ52_12755 [Novosphingobium fuchskuhlense]